MGSFTNLVIFSVIFSFLFFMVSTSSGSGWQQYLSSRLLDASNLNTALLAIGVTALASSIVFPNPYVIFTGMLSFLLGIAPIVSDVLNQFSAVYGVDPNILGFLTTILGLYMGFKLIEWHRGSGPL